MSSKGRSAEKKLTVLILQDFFSNNLKSFYFAIELLILQDIFSHVEVPIGHRQRLQLASYEPVTAQKHCTFRDSCMSIVSVLIIALAYHAILISNLK